MIIEFGSKIPFKDLKLIDSQSSDRKRSGLPSVFQELTSKMKPFCSMKPTASRCRCGDVRLLFRNLAPAIPAVHLQLDSLYVDTGCPRIYLLDPRIRALLWSRHRRHARRDASKCPFHVSLLIIILKTRCLGLESSLRNSQVQKWNSRTRT